MIEKFLFVLFILFLALKLAGTGIVATWSWWYIFSPVFVWVAIIALSIFSILKSEKILAEIESKKPKRGWAKKLEEIELKHRNK